MNPNTKMETRAEILSTFSMVAPVIIKKAMAKNRMNGINMYTIFTLKFKKKFKQKVTNRSNPVEAFLVSKVGRLTLKIDKIVTNIMKADMIPCSVNCTM